MSRIFWYCLFGIYVLFGVLFYLLYIFLISNHYYLDVASFRNLQDLKEQDFEQQLVENHGK
jgi:hypothetical protein